MSNRDQSLANFGMRAVLEHGLGAGQSAGGVNDRSMTRRMLEILNAVKKKVLKIQGGVDCGLAIPWLLFFSRQDLMM